MLEATVALLTSWQNFYVIIGSAAATLTGLMFVVFTLIERIAQQRRRNDAHSVFNTPNVMHFCAALLVAATLSAPWPDLWTVSLPLSLYGLAGVIYLGIVGQRMRRQQIYHPVLEDWLWHVAFPLASYLAFVVAALVLLGAPQPALFIIGAALLLLLFIGIHNAWDIVTYVAFMRPQEDDKQPDQ